MFGDQKDIQKNIKDTGQGNSAQTLGITVKDIFSPISYTKTNKLITALYMVTDIMDKDEPLRNKLRTLGTGIISDINLMPTNACYKIAEIMSFLEIAFAINIISEMNVNILRKEFTELDRSIKDWNEVKPKEKETNLSQFFREELPAPKQAQVSKGHHKSTSIGVQKGSTLLKALSDRNLSPSVNQNFYLKNKRREEITTSIKANGGNATIKDIKDKATGSLTTCGEKTLQRELVAMIKDGVLEKTGKRRWSRYFLKA